MNKNKLLGEILGGSDFVKSDDLIDLKFKIIGKSTVTKVKNYGDAINIPIELPDGTKTSWSTFSEVISGKIAEIEEKKIPYPFSVKLIEKKSKESKFSYYQLVPVEK